MENSGKNRTILWVLIGGGAFFLFMLAVFTLVYISVQNGQERRFAFGVIKLEGIIISPEEIVRDLKRFGDDSSIKAIILHINTPGGGAAASQEIYEQVKRIRDEKKKRIVASIETVGASGGYYVAMGTDKVYANPAAIVGSIGVIAQWVNYGDLMRWARVRDVTLKAGELKDAGSPTRDITPAERAYLQSLIDDMHVQFIDVVAEGRDMEPGQVKQLATGRVWTGSQALPLKLVDELADFQSVVKQTAEDVGIKGEPVLVRPERDRRTLVDVFFQEVSAVLPTRARLLESQVGFFYLWQ